MEVMRTNIIGFQLSGQVEIDTFNSILLKVFKYQKKIGLRDKLLSNEEFELLKEIKTKLEIKNG